jgi:drug/metabolite transporter (DMT)-like permease
LKGSDLKDLVVLGALWGASFLFMRMSAADFGPAPLVFVRVAGACVLLLPLLLWRKQGTDLLQHWKPIALVGLINTALPFLMFVVAAYVLTAGLMAVFNATAPIWGALVAWAWLKERPGGSQMLGLATGLAGVVGLAWGKADFKPGVAGISPALGIAACVVATVLYGAAANYSRKALAGVAPLAVATGSQLSAAVITLVPAWFWWPSTTPSTSAWGAAMVLALACTGLAYVLYFRLIANAGAAQATSVALLIPVFAMVWGWLVLGEQPTLQMLVGCGVILAGTALSTGLLRPAARKANP